MDDGGMVGGGEREEERGKEKKERRKLYFLTVINGLEIKKKVKFKDILFRLDYFFAGVVIKTCLRWKSICISWFFKNINMGYKIIFLWNYNYIRFRKY